MAEPDHSMHASATQVNARLKAAAWQGRLRLGDCWASWHGEVGDGELHRHFAAQAILSEGPIRVFDKDGRYLEACCVLIDPLTHHRIEPGVEALLVYVEPSKHLHLEAEELLRPVRRAKSLATLGSEEGEGFWAPWLSSPHGAQEIVDPRVISALERVESRLAFGAVSLRVAAETSGLSSERFRHLFADEVGIPYKRYVLWRRLRLAAVGLAVGQDVTTAAHRVGFADSAHFARSLKSTFGITASQALTSR